MIRTYTKDESIHWAIEFFNNLGIDASNKEMVAYHDNATFWRRGEPTYSIWFEYIGGSYRFTDFSCFEDKVETMHIEKALLLNTLSDFHINIPEEAEFTMEDKGRYQWEVDKFVKGDTLFDGVITCTYYNDNTIKELNNKLIIYKRIKDVSIKSEKEALKELMSGKFLYYYDDIIYDIIIEKISLDYILDTKGFYLPVYSFESIIDGNKYSIIIPAID